MLKFNKYFSGSIKEILERNNSNIDATTAKQFDDGYK